MNQQLQNIFDRYLYPDQIIFGHLLNPNTKIAHSYQMAKSTVEKTYPDELIVYQKTMSNIKIQSMLNMMEGKHPPLFKSSVLPQSTHVQKHQNSDGTESFEEEEDDYEDYEEDMYMMERDYDDYLDGEYDQEENPFVALGQSMGALPRGKLAAKEFDTPFDIKKSLKDHNARLFMSQHAPSVTQQGLGDILAANRKAQVKQEITKASVQQKNKTETKKDKPNQENSEDDWQTDSEQQEKDKKNVS